MVLALRKNTCKQKSFSQHKSRPMIASEFLENLMNRHENTSTSQVSCPKGSSVQEKHTPYHPEPPYNSSVRNVRKKKSNIARGLISVKPGSGNVLYGEVGMELKKIPGSCALSVHYVLWQYIKKDFWRSSGKVQTLRCGVPLKSLLWLGKKLFSIGKKRLIGGTPWKLLEEVNEVMNLHPLAK